MFDQLVVDRSMTFDDILYFLVDCFRMLHVSNRIHFLRFCSFCSRSFVPLFNTVKYTHRPNNIITSAVAADLASHPSVRGSSKSLGTVTGLINGTGSITASVGLLAVGPLQAAFGWGSVWLYLILCTVTGTALMGKKIYSELFPVAESSSIVV
jgi:heme A synthase